MDRRGCIILAVVLAGPLLWAEQQGRYVSEIPGPVVQLANLPAFEIPVRDLRAEHLEGLRAVKGVTDVRPADSGAVFVFQPFSSQPREDQYAWRKGADRIFKQAPFQTAFGNMAVKECRWIGPRDDATFTELRATLNCRISFANGACLLLRGCAQAEPGTIEHEMVRDLFGAPQSTQPAAAGHALVVRMPTGDVAVWKVNNQFHARLEGPWNEGLLAACVRRFGSQTPSQYRPDQQAWIQDEVRLRIGQLDRAVQWEQQGKGECVWRFAPYLTDQFPDVFTRFGTVDLRDPQAKTVRWFQNVRAFLLAHQAKFRYDPDSWGFVLLP